MKKRTIGSIIVGVGIGCLAAVAHVELWSLQGLVFIIGVSAVSLGTSIGGKADR